jgi:hypothetical protein
LGSGSGAALGLGAGAATGAGLTVGAGFSFSGTSSSHAARPHVRVNSTAIFEIRVTLDILSSLRERSREKRAQGKR